MNVDQLKIGDAIKFDEFYWELNHIRGDHWGVFIGRYESLWPDALIYTRDAEGKWHSRVMPIGGDDRFKLAQPKDVPDDIPEDFWPTVARYKLLGEAV